MRPRDLDGCRERGRSARRGAALSPFAHALVGDLLPVEAQAELLGRPLSVSHERLCDRSRDPLTRAHEFPSSILWPVTLKVGYIHARISRNGNRETASRST